MIFIHCEISNDTDKSKRFEKELEKKNFREIPRSKLRFEKVIFDCSHGSS